VEKELSKGLFVNREGCLMKEHYWIPGRGQRLSAMLHQPTDARRDTPLIICCHGFTGDKVGANQLTLNLAKKLSQAGYYALRFDFLGSGDSEGEFASDTIVSGWQADLRNVVDWVKQQARFAEAPILLYGHSLGGLIALTALTDEPKIAGRIVFAPVLYPIANFQNIILGPELWAQSAAGKPIANFFAKGFSLQEQFVKDLLANAYDPIGEATKLQTPLLIIHGTSDLAVPPAGSEELLQKYPGPKEIHRPQIDHVATGFIEVLPQIIIPWIGKKIYNERIIKVIERGVI
jgi:alpha-beta hydrolase superfamily lysophospholipase